MIAEFHLVEEKYHNGIQEYYLFIDGDLKLWLKKIVFEGLRYRNKMLLIETIEKPGLTVNIYDNKKN